MTMEITNKVNLLGTPVFPPVQLLIQGTQLHFFYRLWTIKLRERSEIIYEALVPFEKLGSGHVILQLHTHYRVLHQYS